MRCGSKLTPDTDSFVITNFRRPRVNRGFVLFPARITEGMDINGKFAVSVLLVVGFVWSSGARTLEFELCWKRRSYLCENIP